MRFSCAARTDQGRLRAGNEDNYLMQAECGLFIVADGMGGHAAGAVASEMAVRLVSHGLGCARGLSGIEVSDRVQTAIRRASRAIFERSLRELATNGMGTTATALVLQSRGYVIGHVGDSRVYLLRHGALVQLTRDHSYVQELVDAGVLTPAQARLHPYRKLITRCIGLSADVVPDMYHGALQRGDVLLIASDGVTRMLEDADLIRILSAHGGPHHWVDRLILEANDRGGEDNSTAIAIHIESLGSAAGEPPTARTSARSVG